eukprot:1136981-Pelagomonas_calceolata.AAC.3
MFRLLCHAMHSSLQTIESVATFMLLPHWRGFSCNAYMTWFNHYPDLAKLLAKFPTRNVQFQSPQHWFDTISNPTPPSYPMQLIVVWSLNARVMLDAHRLSWCGRHSL